MCGIAGFANFKQDFTEKMEYYNRILVDMRTSIKHRGQDGCGEYLRKHVGFSHARLSIRDLSFGTQPMIRSFGGAEYAIVYNGEIYNVDEIGRAHV